MKQQGLYLQVNQSIVKLLEKKVAGGHTLTPWNRVALTGRCAHHLEILLGLLQELCIIHILTQTSAAYSLHYVLLGGRWFERLHHIVCFLDLCSVQWSMSGLHNKMVCTNN